MHERFDRTEASHGSSDRSFGIVMAVFFLIIACIPLLEQPRGGLTMWALVVAGVFLVLAIFWARALRPLNWLWMGLGYLLSMVMSPIAIALLFFLGVAPVGFVFRILGKDTLNLRRDPAAASYWIPRQPPGPSPDSMENQF